MKDRGHGERGTTGGRLRYRDTVQLIREYLRPVEPASGFSRNLEGLCESMGARELFGSKGAGGGESRHRGMFIGGAICSALPFVGVAAYAISKHLLRRRVVPVGI